MEARVRIGNIFPQFPKTVGDLFGHELKVRENNITPYSIVKKINLYNRHGADIPFLILDVTSSERCGMYSKPIWYPKFRLESSDEHANDVRAFVVTPELYLDRVYRDNLVEMKYGK
ncbi:hypothetical protein [Tichowtungia aerotolerans]|uniref:Uncharacterized protein n=1 Tax=Tichowtungia aerotolerans TaxID=2697043 RepID=A0A6P1M4C1_9BACT|nr:hypothetical protein [Tichowtungia aerotolerans]QHI68691.1 hypothetical protein GT409_04265 [Tichowtungia aerotolerans]